MTLTREDVLAIVAEEARIDPARLEPHATLASLGIASIDVVSVLFAIEDKCGIEIPVEDVASAETLDAFVDAVVAQVAAA